MLQENIGKHFIILDWKGFCNLAQNPAVMKRKIESENNQLFGNIQLGDSGETQALIQTMLTGV